MVTVWYSQPGRWPSYEHSVTPLLCSTVAARDGQFDVHHGVPGTYGPRHDPPHLKYLVRVGDRTCYGTVPVDVKRMVTFVKVEV